MYKLLALTAVLALASGRKIPFPDGKIVGGVETTIEQHPYQVSIQREGEHICGGSLYKDNIVITAAHCLQGKIKTKDLTVRVGSTKHNKGEINIGIRAYKNHPDYNPYFSNNDIAIMKLKEKVSLSSSVRLIELATSTPRSGTTAVVSGWGMENFYDEVGPENLMKVEVKIINQEECASSKFQYGDIIDETMLCAVEAGKDACQGDSGGPLVSGNKLVGVVSWGNKCGEEGFPGVYADVAVLNSWVVEASKRI